MNTATADFASALRDWRRTRGMSQLSLALAANVSTRHVGFLEVGRAQPSRAMVLNLAQALDVPLRERNQLLVAAGFAPLYRHTPLADEALEPVRRALGFMLDASAPHPCVIVNRRYDVLMANRPARWLFDTFCEAGAPTGEGANLVRLLTESPGLAPAVVNRDAVLRKVLGRVRRDLGPSHRRDADDDRTLARAEAAWSALDTPAPTEPPLPMIGLQLARGDLRLDLFTTIATLGTPLDVTLQEIRIETFFPADAASRQVLSTIGR